MNYQVMVNYLNNNKLREKLFYFIQYYFRDPKFKYLSFLNKENFKSYLQLYKW